MLTLLGSLLGFVSSVFPELLRLVQAGQTRKHELAILDRKLSQARLEQDGKLQQLAIKADSDEATALYAHDTELKAAPWVEALRASVRPVITYAFFLLFTSVKLAALWLLIDRDGLQLIEALPRIWDSEIQTLFAAVMSFWFGQRALAKIRKNH